MSESLVDKRLKYIERQRALHRDAVDVRFEGLTPVRVRAAQSRRHAAPARWANTRFATGPCSTSETCPPSRPSDWTLEVGGLVENPLTFTWEQFLALPQVDDVSDFHCVTTWSRFENHWRGVRFKTLAELAVPTPDAQFVLCTGYNHAPGTRIPYTTNLPLARAVEDDVLLVHTWEGAPLPREHGGPCRMITPKLYAWKGTKWIRRIDFLAANTRGFWEERGYSDTAEPWFNDRYSS